MEVAEAVVKVNRLAFGSASGSLGIVVAASVMAFLDLGIVMMTMAVRVP